MIFTQETARQQFEELSKNQNGLYIESETEEKIEIVGKIFVNLTLKGFTLSDYYAVKIVVPLGSDELPYVFDAGNHIAEDYPHRYKNGVLCLETDTNMRIRFLDGFSLSKWMQKCVEPYYFSYEYYQRYRELPFGERSHGLLGVLETYQELFHEEDPVKVLALMRSICEDSYRGHALCPCGSKRRFRICHGPTIMKYYTDKRLKKIVSSDYTVMKDCLVKYYEQLQHCK